MKSFIKRILAHKRRAAAGFTLAEVLISVAILGVLAFLGIPRLVTYQREMRLTLLDETAREIYAASQNSLTRISNSGSLGKLADTAMDGEPEDYTGPDWNSVKSHFYFTVSRAEAADLLLPLGSIEEDIRLEGSYFIEYDLKTATVYGVFYSEQPLGIYDSSYLNGLRQDREARGVAKTGYYGGAGGVSREDFEHCKTPVLSVENKDTLKMNITGLEAGYTVRVVLEDMTDNTKHVELLSTAPTANFAVSAVGCTLTLDSLTVNERFLDYFTDPVTLQPTLTPGADIKATVYFEKSGWFSSFATVSFNSLFAARGTDADAGKVQINCARHLQNLSTAWSGVDDTVTDAEQTANISFPTGVSFSSVTNASLDSYDGKGLRITGLTGANGLFSSFTGSELKNIRLVDPNISNTGAAATGVLAGSASGCEISGCQVYVENKLNGNKVDYTKYANYGLNASGVAGGLVGSAANCTVRESFAALPILRGTSSTAGLIGNASNTTVTSCYSACDDLINGTGMLVGGGSGSNVSNCYAVGNTRSATELPFASGAAAKSSYCAFSYLQTDGVTKYRSSNYDVYGADGAVTHSDPEHLRTAAVGSWGSCSAALTRPYKQLLDGRAYPYAAVPGLQHWGSWPTESGMKLRVVLRLDTGFEDYNAGDVSILEVGSNAVLFPTPTGVYEFDVPVGSELAVSVSARSGYEYLYSQLDSDPTFTSTYSNNSYHFRFTPRSDGVLYLTFGQTAFTLNCHRTSTNNCSYSVTAGTLRLSADTSSSDSGRVFRDTTVVVTPQPRNNWYVSAVSYVAGGVTTRVNRGADGKYSFHMPSADTEVTVTFINTRVSFTVNCYLMDADGNYPGNNDPTDTWQEYLGVGTVIDSALMDTFAESSGIPLSVNGVDCIELDESLTRVTRYGTSVTMPYTANNPNTSFTVRLYFSRAEFNVKLNAGSGIASVAFQGSSGAQQTQRSFRYGKSVTVTAAETDAGAAPFTHWSERSGRLSSSGEKTFTFTVTASDLELTANADPNQRLVTLSIFKNGVSWLYSDRRGYPELDTITLKTLDGSNTVPLANPKDAASSSLVQALAPTGHYYVMVNGNEYTENGAALVLDCTGGAVNGRLDFYSLSYDPNAERYTGSLPTGGVYPSGYVYTVPGNTGLLVNTSFTDPSGNVIDSFFTGWRNTLDPHNPHPYKAGETLAVTGRTALFANWVSGLTVSYSANGADGGSLPFDATKYEPGDYVTIMATDLSRTGYDFLGWSDGLSQTLYNAGNRYQLGDNDLSLSAQWAIKTFSVRRFNESGTEISGGSTSVKYLNTFTVPSYTAAVGKTFVGWSNAPGGAVVCMPGDVLTVTGGLDLYARVVDSGDTVTLTYNRVLSNGTAQSYSGSPVTVGRNIPYRLHCAAAAGVLGWSYGEVIGGAVRYTGNIIRCDEWGYSNDTLSFSSNTQLYAISGKVYNRDSFEWYDTLGEAVSNSATHEGDTLVVYGDTLENGQININKGLSILADGHRTVSWSGSAAISSTRGRKYSDGSDGGKPYYEVHGGCLSISAIVCLGAQNVDSGEMDYSANTLSFDAAQKGRVVCLEPNSTLYMYEGVYLKNGKPSDTTTIENVDYQHCGGGVFVNPGALLCMRGGEISFCSAAVGGGVYLINDGRMEMGRMLTAASLGQGFIEGGVYYSMSSQNVFASVEDAGPGNYLGYYVPWGNPRINNNSSYRTASQTDQLGSYWDGGAGLCTVELDQNDLLLYCGEICYNHSTGNGGGILIDAEDDDNHLRIYDVLISGNRALNGGGVFQWQGILDIYNSVIFQNYAESYGGGICLNEWNNGIAWDTSDVELYSGVISNNYANGRGGGIYVRDGADLSFLGGSLTDNSSPLGGGVYMDGGSSIYGSLMLSGGSIISNTDVDIYLGDNKSISVPDSGLALDPAVHTQTGDDIVLTCESPHDFLTVLQYGLTGFNSSDANLFRYSNSAWTVASNAIWRTLRLEADNGRRQLLFYSNNGTDEYSAQSFAIGEDALAAPGESAQPMLRTALRSAVASDPVSAPASDPVSDSASDSSADTDIGVLPQLSWEYHKFIGWGLSPDARPEDALTSYEVSELHGQALYAIWGNYTLSYDVSGAPVAVETPAAEQGPEEFTLKTLTAPAEGFTSLSDDGTRKYSHSFLGWSRTQGATALAEGDYPVGTEHRLRLNEDVTLYAVWKSDVVPGSLIYDPNFPAASGVGERLEVAVSKGCTFVFPTDAQAAGFTMTGYDLTGWNTKADGSGISYVPGSSAVKTGADAVTLYAQWHIMTFTVRYFLNNDSAPQQANYSDQTYDYAAHLNLPPDPVWEHYCFGGWAIGSLSAYQGAPVMQNLDLTARWYPQPYTLTFDPNGGVGTVSGGDTVSWGQTDYRLPDGGFTRDGYAFTGWNTASDGSGRAYAPGALFTPAASDALDIIIYAQWSPTFAVSFNVNCTDGLTAPDVQQLPSGGLAAAPTLSRRGYTLLGWNTAPDGSGTDISAAITGNTVFYAVWQPLSYNVSFDAQGGSAVAAQTVDFGAYPALPAPPVRDGFVFLSWSLDGVTAVDVTQCAVTADTVFLALWESV